MYGTVKTRSYFLNSCSHSSQNRHVYCSLRYPKDNTVTIIHDENHNLVLGSLSQNEEANDASHG